MKHLSPSFHSPFLTISMTTKFFALLSFLVSPILTMSPSPALMLSGLCALSFDLIFLYLSYFGTYFVMILSTVTVFGAFALITFPVRTAPLTLKLFTFFSAPCFFSAIFLTPQSLSALLRCEHYGAALNQGLFTAQREFEFRLALGHGFFRASTFNHERVFRFINHFPFHAFPAFIA